MWPDWMLACREMNVVPVYLRELHWYVLQCERFFRIHAGRGSDVQVTVIFSISLTCLVRYWFKCPQRLSSFPVILVVSEWILTLECMWFLCAVFYFILFWYIYIYDYIHYTYACVYTLKGCAGCLVVSFFSFPKWNLVVVEKHLGFCYLLIVLHSFFLQLHLL